jgi:hypothetical protein
MTRLHNPDEEADLVWVGNSDGGSWLVRVHPRFTESFLRPKNRGLMPRGKHFGPDHHADAVLYIRAKLKQEWEGT